MVYFSDPAGVDSVCPTGSGSSDKTAVGACLASGSGVHGPVFMFRALQDMPLFDVTVIVFGSTFMTTALSVPLFKEKVGLHRWGAVILGLIGVVIALRPGTDVFNPSALFALLAGLSFAGINLTARWLRDTESTFQLIFYLMIGITLLSSMAMPWVWVTVEIADWAIFGAMGIFTIVGYIFMTRAFMVAPTGLVAPCGYTVLIWAVALGSWSGGMCRIYMFGLAPWLSFRADFT